MTTFNLAGIMDAIAAALVVQKVMPAGNVHAFPTPSFDPPCIVVDYPAPGMITLDLTAKRGGIEATFLIWVVIGAYNELPSRNALSALLDGGAATVKTALEADGTLGGVVASTMVRGPDIGKYQDQGGADYLAAKFDVEVIA